MSAPNSERNYIVGIYLSALDDQPRFRHVYGDMARARQDINRWLSQGYIHVIDLGLQDHYAPTQIYKVRIMGITKMVTKPSTAEAVEMGFIDEEAYWLDESGATVDPKTVPM